MNNQNSYFETPDLGFAAYLVLQEVPYFGVKWTSPQQAVFIFQTPSNTILADWLKADGDRFRQFRKAIDTLRDDLLGTKGKTNAK